MSGYRSSQLFRSRVFLHEKSIYEAGIWQRSLPSAVPHHLDLVVILKTDTLYHCYECLGQGLRDFASMSSYMSMQVMYWDASFRADACIGSPDPHLLKMMVMGTGASTHLIVCTVLQAGILTCHFHEQGIPSSLFHECQRRIWHVF